MTSGFITPSDPVRAAAEDRRYLRTEGGALMRLGKAPDDHLMWVCGGCAAYSVCAWPLDRPAATRYATQAEAWAGAEDSALAHARSCFEPVSAAAPAPKPAPPLIFEVDPWLPVRLEPLVSMVRVIAPGAARLVAEKTGRTVPPSTRIVATTWYGMIRHQLAESLAAVSDLPSPPDWKARARLLLNALRTLPTPALAIPDRNGGVMVLVNLALAAGHSGPSIRTKLQHQFVHVLQLGDPARRAQAVCGLRIGASIDQDEAETEARAAESWTWQQVETERAREEATQRAEHAEQQERGQAEAACGRKRTACTWCDGEFYVPQDEPGPHSCPACDYKNGY